MYKKKLTSDSRNSFNGGFCDNKVKHHSPSYYLRGGIDLARRDRPPLPVATSHSDDVADNVVNAFADPRMSKIDLLVMASRVSSAKRKEEIKAEI